MDWVLKQQCKQTVYYTVPTGLDVAGQPTMAAATTYKVRVESRTKEVREPTGIQNKTSHIVICDEEFPVALTALDQVHFWLPWEAPTTHASRPVKAVSVCYDENSAVSHLEFTL
jgi:hypothetical protein